MGGLQGEEEEAAGDLPEHLLRDEHAGPLLAAIVQGGSHGGIQAGDQPHALQLGDQVPAL